jgi:hypothetical protein
VPGALFDDLLRLAVSSSDLLAMCMPVIQAPLLRCFYREHASRQGWLDRHGRIQCKTLIHAAANFSLAQADSKDLVFCGQPHWIFKLLYKHRAAMHPLKHLALMTLLATSPQALRAHCKCAEISPEVEAVAGGNWNAGTGLDDSQTRSRRQRFLDQCKNLSARQAHDYMWLYRHDRTWLRETIKQGMKPRQAVQEKVAWTQRDQQFADQVRQHAALLYHADERTRISKTRLAKATGRHPVIEKYSAKLPLTIQALQAFAETVEAFQCRRLRRIVRECRAEKDQLMRWRILRRAGLAPPLAPLVEQALAALLR